MGLVVAGWDSTPTSSRRQGSSTLSPRRHPPTLDWEEPLKIGEFDPRDAGQLNFYVNVIDEQRRLPGHAPTLGLLLCSGHGTSVVRYSLAGMTTPLAVAAYTYDALPADAQAVLPPEAAIRSSLE